MRAKTLLCNLSVPCSAKGIKIDKCKQKECFDAHMTLYAHRQNRTEGQFAPASSLLIAVIPKSTTYLRAGRQSGRQEYLGAPMPLQVLQGKAMQASGSGTCLAVYLAQFLPRESHDEAVQVKRLLKQIKHSAQIALAGAAQPKPLPHLNALTG